ncbi:hypothetical protein LZF95_05400 [Algoriphagus sp. AGSA1]|uniref:hypothetical protein n=1 Tax=Algoriphagus sp. AGSA1 TaxID=2907213 RepID=UPI001F2F3CF2|nr:hypothetical protein [Algoriphagus sp. AGSA1]MCE7054102.1 hypothetical protein [Algoriphagus sp. AGSA1]
MVPIHVVIEKVVQTPASNAGERTLTDVNLAANTITGQLTGQSYCQNFYYPNKPLEIFKKNGNFIANTAIIRPKSNLNEECSSNLLENKIEYGDLLR